MKILALTHRLPYAPNRGDRIRAYHLLRVLSRSADVHLFSLAGAGEVCQAAAMRSWLSSVTLSVPRPLVNRMRGTLTLAGPRPLTHTLLDAPRIEFTIAELARRVQPDVVLAYCSGMARFTVDGPLQHIPYVLDMVDVDSAKWAALSRSSPGPLKWVYTREARVLRAFETRACQKAAVTLVVNARERDTLAEIAPGSTITVVENGVDLDYFAPPAPAADSKEIVFCGVMDYQPNVEAVLWFVHSVWASVRRSVPDARLTIVGSAPVPEVQRLAAIEGIEVTGAVRDVRPFLWRSAVSIAPLRTARGLQNKVLEALAAGLPVVTTHQVAAGLPPSVVPGCQITNDAEGCARAIVQVLAAAPSSRRQMAASANLQGRSWGARLGEVPHILRAAAEAQAVRS